ncbi:MAG: class I SAM-dependent methyltransferase [Hamadaea sp.]|uniref:class I SAM-dependent methyltransferase n=1 Tax=Hamadaea sp. TaxID=2024425 RepID=UPI001831482C|nr:class I SAM-dependent methyltransferase [Hamadaea sp.]NUR72334.1 class I SAM-dependent methyltransferase [Hamadaea sp.]NUT18441.1 class I SAM-dependent methyltransferase [Hamadaea sp.]
MISDAEFAALYDVLNPWDVERYASDAFYHRLVMASDAVLDVGCGTGSMLHYARSQGHRGRLVGLEPDPAMLARASMHTDVEWVSGAAADAAWSREFGLATMTSHAFQCLISDDELRASLTAIRAALRDGGRFAFETRHPQARAWEDWNPGNVTEIADPPLRSWHRVDTVDGDVVTFTSLVSDTSGAVLRTEQTALRFLDVATLNAFIDEAGFAIDDQFGGWDGTPIGPDSREIITIARRR